MTSSSSIAAMERCAPVGELPFRIGFTGHSGHLRLEPLPPVERPSPLGNLPDLILPPAFEPETLETLKKNVENEFLMPDLDHDEFRPDKCGRQWEFDWFSKAMVHLEPSLPRLTVVPVWEPPYRRGQNKAPLKHDRKEEEQTVSEDAIKKNSNNWVPQSLQIEVRDIERSQGSSSVLRRPGPPEDFVRGNTNNRPFLPGGFEESRTTERYLPKDALNGDWIRDIIEGGPMQTIPPGFKDGLDLGAPKAFSRSSTAVQVDHLQTVDKEVPSNKMGGLSVQFDDLFKKAWEESYPDEDSDEGEEIKRTEHIIIEDKEVGKKTCSHDQNIKIQIR